MIRSGAILGLLLCTANAFAATDSIDKIAPMATGDTLAAGVSGPLVVEYYDVFGTSSRELRKDLDLKRPSNRYGERFDGITRWQVNWSYDFSGDGKSCQVQVIKAVLKASMELPRWVPSADTSQRLVSEWEQYSTALRQHEDGHYALAVEAAAELERRLAQRRGTSGCDALSRQVDKAADGVLGEYAIKQAEYDLLTDHGATQGALFPR